MKTTHTYATLEVSKAAYDEIAGKLRAAGYEHVFGDEGEMDMQGIALLLEQNMNKSKKPGGVKQALLAGKRVAMLAVAAVRKVALRAATGIPGTAISVDKDAGVIRNVAVMCDGDTGYGFAIDKTTREQAMALINAAEGGIKMHFKHPKVETNAAGDVTAVEDQLGALVGRLKNAKLDGPALRADIYLGEYAKNMPGLGDAWTYLLTVAANDPAAIGLSAVFNWEPEVILDADQKPKMIAARVSELHQVDFVGQGAATPNGLLQAKTPKLALLATADEMTGALAALATAAGAALAGLRQLMDATVAGEAGPVVAAATVAALAAYAVTVAARTWIDLCNATPDGSMSMEDVGDSALPLVRQLRLLSDECADVLDIMGRLSWGTTDLARAAQAAAPLIRTCLCTVEDAVNCALPLTYSQSFLAKHHTLADACGLDMPALAKTARTAQLSRQIKRGEPVVEDHRAKKV